LIKVMMASIQISLENPLLMYCWKAFLSMGHNLISCKGKNFVAWYFVFVTLNFLLKSLSWKNHFYPLYFIFSFGFAQDKFDISAVQEFQKKINDEYANQKKAL
jgi:hypothetical protein